MDIEIEMSVATYEELEEAVARLDKIKGEHSGNYTLRVKKLTDWNAALTKSRESFPAASESAQS